MGYSEAELAAVPEGANLGLGCAKLALSRPASHPTSKVARWSRAGRPAAVSKITSPRPWSKPASLERGE